MNAQEFWNKYKKVNPLIGGDIDTWRFELEADLLAKLVLEGTKTAAASACNLYAVDNNPLPEAGSYGVILNNKDQAVYIIQIKKASVVPFKEVSEEHAFKESEDSKSLAYWRDVHEAFFKPYFKKCRLAFTPENLIILGEFEMVYPTV